MLRWAARLSAYKVQVPQDRCVTCHLCSEACPVGAIVPPRPRRYGESKEHALRRLRWLAALTPALVALGLLAGSLLTGPLSRLQPDMVLYNQVEAGARDTDGVYAFLVNDGDTKGLHERTTHARRRLATACCLFGAFLSLVFVAAVVSATVRRHNEDYEVDAGTCLSCGRCYEWCPRNPCP